MVLRAKVVGELEANVKIHGTRKIVIKRLRFDFQNTVVGIIVKVKNYNIKRIQ